jgi:hypothetical protein
MDRLRTLVAVTGLLALFVLSLPCSAQNKKPSRPHELKVILTSSGKRQTDNFDEKVSIRVAESVQVMLNTNGKRFGSCVFSSLAKNTLLIGKRRGFAQVVYNLTTDEITVTEGGIKGPCVTLGHQDCTVVLCGSKFTFQTVVEVMLPRSRSKSRR